MRGLGSWLGSEAKKFVSDLQSEWQDEGASPNRAGSSPGKADAEDVVITEPMQQEPLRRQFQATTAKHQEEDIRWDDDEDDVAMPSRLPAPASGVQAAAVVHHDEDIRWDDDEDDDVVPAARPSSLSAVQASPKEAGSLGAHVAAPDGSAAAGLSATAVQLDELDFDFGEEEPAAACAGPEAGADLHGTCDTGHSETAGVAQRVDDSRVEQALVAEAMQPSDLDFDVDDWGNSEAAIEAPAPDAGHAANVEVAADSDFDFDLDDKPVPASASHAVNEGSFLDDHTSSSALMPSEEPLSGPQASVQSGDHKEDMSGHPAVTNEFDLQTHALEPADLPSSFSASKFTVTLERVAGIRLGMVLDDFCSGGLIVSDLLPEGLAKDWNTSHPEMQIKVGSRLIEVNGVSDASGMFDECSSNNVLRMCFLNGEVSEVAAEGVDLQEAPAEQKGNESAALASQQPDLDLDFEWGDNPVEPEASAVVCDSGAKATGTFAEPASATSRCEYFNLENDSSNSHASQASQQPDVDFDFDLNDNPEDKAIADVPCGLVEPSPLMAEGLVGSADITAPASQLPDLGVDLDFEWGDNAVEEAPRGIREVVDETCTSSMTQHAETDVHTGCNVNPVVESPSETHEVCNEIESVPVAGMASASIAAVGDEVPDSDLGFDLDDEPAEKVSAEVPKTEDLVSAGITEPASQSLDLDLDFEWGDKPEEEACTTSPEVIAETVEASTGQHANPDFDFDPQDVAAEALAKADAIALAPASLPGDNHEEASAAAAQGSPTSLDSNKMQLKMEARRALLETPDKATVTIEAETTAMKAMQKAADVAVKAAEKKARAAEAMQKVGEVELRAAERKAKAAEEALAEAKAALENASAEAAAAEAEKDRYKQQAESNGAASASFEAELAAAREQAAAAEVELERYKQQAESTGTENASLQAELVAVREEASAAVADVERYKQQAESTGAENASLRAELAAVREEAASVEASAADAEVERYKQQAEDTGTENAQLRAELAAVREEARRAQTAWSQQICSDVKSAICDEAEKARKESQAYIGKLGHDFDKMLEDLRSMANRRDASDS